MGGLFSFLRQFIRWLLFWDEAVALNLTLDPGVDMAKIGDSRTARIAPTNAAGLPAPVFNADWIEDGESYNVSPAPDGLSAVYTAVSAGQNNMARVIAITQGGAVLVRELFLPDVEADVDLEAVELNLTLDA